MRRCSPEPGGRPALATSAPPLLLRRSAVLAPTCAWPPPRTRRTRPRWPSRSCWAAGSAAGAARRTRYRARGRRAAWGARGARRLPLRPGGAALKWTGPGRAGALPSVPGPRPAMLPRSFRRRLRASRGSAGGPVPPRRARQVPCVLRGKAAESLWPVVPPPRGARQHDSWH